MLSWMVTKIAFGCVRPRTLELSLTLCGATVIQIHKYMFHWEHSQRTTATSQCSVPFHSPSRLYQLTVQCLITNAMCCWPFQLSAVKHLESISVTRKTQWHTTVTNCVHTQAHRQQHSVHELSDTHDTLTYCSTWTTTKDSCLAY